MHRRRLLVLAAYAPFVPALHAVDVKALTDAQRQRASELLLKLKALADLPEVLEPVLKDEVEGIDVKVREALSLAIDDEVPKAAAAYRNTFRTAASASTGRFKTKETIAEVKKLRDAVLSLSGFGDRLTKEMIIEKGALASTLFRLRRLSRTSASSASQTCQAPCVCGRAGAC